MTQKSRTDLITEITANINDNTSGDITAADLRGALQNLSDSCFNAVTDGPMMTAVTVTTPIAVNNTNPASPALSFDFTHANTWTGQQVFNTAAPQVGTATASTIAGFDASKNLTTLATATYPSLAELAYIKGVTASIQPQIDNIGTSQTMPTYVPKFRAALAKMQTGTSKCTVLCIGDSQTAGFGSGGGGSGFPNKPYSYPSQLANYLTNNGIAAREASFMGTNVDTVNTTSAVGYDPRMTIGGGWAANGAQSLGGFFFYNNTNTNTLSFAPTQVFDNFDVYYAATTTNSIFTVNIDGGATLATINSGTIPGIFKATVTAPLGVHTININRSSGSIYIESIITRNSTVKEVSIINAGQGASKASDIATTATVYNPSVGIQLLAPDLTILCLVTNDIGAQTNVTTYTSSLQAIVTAAQASGDVIMVLPVPNATTNYINNSAAYIAAFKSVAATNNCLVIDAAARWVSYTVSNARGYFYDTIHPNAAGYGDFATIIGKVICSVAGGSYNNCTVGNIGSYRGGSQTLLGLAATPTPVITNSGTAGSTTYSYKIVCKQADGSYTAAGTAGTTTTGNATLSSGNFNNIVWQTVPGTEMVDVYRTVGGTIGKIGSNIKANFLADTGLVGDGTTAPTTDITGNLTASRIIKSGGTSAQFLKADGSIDNTTYQGALTLTTTGTSGSSTLVGNILNVPNYATGVTSVSGTVNRVTSTGGTTPIIDISAAYVGQSSITTLGTIAAGAWQATSVAGQYGGTGVNNSGKTITLGGNLVTSGAFATTLTATATTNVTLPATGTLATLAGSETLTNKSVNGVTLTAAGSATAYLNGAGAYTAPAGAAIGGAVTSGTTGSVLFIGASAALTQDNANFFWDDANNLLGLGTSTPTAKLDAAASTTTNASIRIRSGTAPTSPNDGDMWYDGTNLKFRVGGTTKTVTLT